METYCECGHSWLFWRLESEGVIWSVKETLDAKTRRRSEKMKKRRGKREGGRERAKANKGIRLPQATVDDLDCSSEKGVNVKDGYKGIGSTKTATMKAKKRLILTRSTCCW